MPKAEISWKRTSEEGEKLQIYAHLVGGDWRFFMRGKRYDQWEAVDEPPLEDWLALLDAIRRYIPRRRYHPNHEQAVLEEIRHRYPEWSE